MTESNAAAPRAAGTPRASAAVKFAVALSNCFRLPGEKLGEWSAQIKALTAKDKADLHAYMTEAGLNVEPPVSA